MGNFIFEEKSMEKLIQIIEKINLCDTWRIRNSKIKRFTFWQHYTSGYIERRFEYFLVSNLLQESVNKTDLLAAFSTDQSLLLFSLDLRKNLNRGKGLWKFNNSLSMNCEFVTKELQSFDLKWEIVRYEIRKF